MNETLRSVLFTRFRRPQECSFCQSHTPLAHSPRYSHSQHSIPSGSELFGYILPKYFSVAWAMRVCVCGIDSGKWKRKMNLLSNNEWNKLCACVLYIISCNLSHFIWYVISVKHVFIIRIHRFAMHFNHNKCLHILSMCLLYGCQFFFFCVQSLARTYSISWFQIHFIEIKQLERKPPSARLHFITSWSFHLASYVLMHICHSTKWRRNEERAKRRTNWTKNCSETKESLCSVQCGRI